MTPVRIGLTGSIGMGKTTTARMFADEGAEVWDADAAVHEVYAQGAGVPVIADLAPEAVRDGAVDRTRLANWVQGAPDRLRRLERAVHPLVGAHRAAFLRESRADVVVLDIPLLFETGSDAGMDVTVVVSAAPDVQRDRVLARPGMTPEKLALILGRQMPDAEKRARADVVIDTTTLEGARRDVRDLMAKIRAGAYARNRS